MVKKKRHSRLLVRQVKKIEGTSVFDMYIKPFDVALFSYFWKKTGVVKKFRRHFELAFP